MSTGCPSPIQQPAFFRLADVLFCPSLGFGLRAALPQTTVSPAFI
jgi:hypothetical protein